MDKDKVIGIADEAAGRAKREAGSWAGDGELEVEGMIQQAKGKLELVWSKAKEAVHGANVEAGAPPDK